MKSITKKIIYSCLVLMLLSTSLVFGQNKAEKDIYGREIIDSKGKKINYSKSDFVPSTPKLKSASFHQEFASPVQSNTFKDTLFAKVENLFSIVGTSIGRNSMHSMDVDGDGSVELICTAATQGFGLADYWYLMHYNAADSTCNQIWTSPQYTKNISTLEVVDFANDTNYQILLGFEDGTIQIYDGKTRELVKEVKPVSEKINSIVYADADNDNKKDIVISCENNTYILDANTFVQNHKIEQGGYNVRVGNIDSDSYNEIVLSSGTAYQISNSILKTIWKFNSTSYGFLELSDFDKDSKQEIVLADSWYKINVFDADTKTTKYTINADLDINCLYLKDVNNDGTDEILYGDGQWGEVYCYNAVTHTKMWSVNNPEHGVAAINYADLNSDGKQELIWSAGWTSTGEDYLYIYNVASNKLLWRSADIVGPFYALAKGDVDSDGKEEIVAVSNESDSGYGSGVLIIIDSETNKVKWKSNGNFLYLVWTGIYDVAIKNIDNDSQNEIIIAAGQTYTGEIWIIDGKNHSIKSSHIFSSENVSEFYSLAVDDIDNDGSQELLAVSNSTLYVINPSNWSIKWSVTISSSYSKSIIRCVDLNGDGKKETIICKGTIQIVNGADQSIWSTQETNFVNIDIYDSNGDGIQDIIASTNNGHIITIDGKFKTTIKDINPESAEISSVRMQKLGNSNIYVYSCDGRINFYKNDSTCNVTQLLGRKIGEIEGLKVVDVNSDSYSILIGTPTSVLKIPGNIINCLNFNIKINESIVSCDKNDGKLKLTISGGILPYKYLWDDNSKLDSIVNLKPGIYSVRVQDNGGCSKLRSMNLQKASISANLQVTNEGCSEKGSAHVNITHVNSPYSIKWSTLQSSLDINNLSAGNYSVVITDSKNCVYEDVAIIKKDTVIMDASVQNVTCFGENNGSISLYRISGVSPLIYKWNGGEMSNFLNFQKAGKYNVLITDALGCTSNLSFEITQPEKITYNKMISPDNLNTQNWEGKVIIENINGGISPYQVYWPRFLKYSDFLEVMPSGKYAFVVIDANNCEIKDTADITSFRTGIENISKENFKVYPNPVKNELFITKPKNDKLNYGFEVISSNGQVVLKKEQVFTDESKFDLTNLKPGLYLLRFNLNNTYYYKEIIKE